MANLEATPNFTESSQALMGILERFRSGKLTLEEALELFESGVQHVRICQEKLAQSQGQVAILTESLQMEVFENI